MTDVKEVIPDYSDIPSMARLPTTFGDFMIRVFHEEETGFDHVALTLGDMAVSYTHLTLPTSR